MGMPAAATISSVHSRVRISSSVSAGPAAPARNPGSRIVASDDTQPSARSNHQPFDCDTFHRMPAAEGEMIRHAMARGFTAPLLEPDAPYGSRG